MTIAEFHITSENWAVKIKGHAERREGENGNQVCAAISILSHALVQCGREYAVYMTDYKDIFKQEKAYTYVFCSTDNPDIAAHIQGMFHIVESGLRMLAETFPDQVKVIGGELENGM